MGHFQLGVAKSFFWLVKLRPERNDIMPEFALTQKYDLVHWYWLSISIPKWSSIPMYKFHSTQEQYKMSQKDDINKMSIHIFICDTWLNASVEMKWKFVVLGAKIG